MGEAKPRTEGSGGEVELWKSETDVQRDGAGRDAGSTTLAGVSSRARAASEDAVTAAMPWWS